MDDKIANHYYECHVTIEPIFDDLLEQAKALALEHKFKIATLLMKKREEDTEQRSQYDTFMTSNGKSLNEMKDNVIKLVTNLREKGFKVWRYKIEDTILDSRILDTLRLL